MKKYFVIPMVGMLWCVASFAQKPTAAGAYASDIRIVMEAQDQALKQAQEVVDQGGNESAVAILKAAIKEMERSRVALEGAKKSPEKLGGAIAAAESAYQALLKATPREYRMSRSRSQSGQGAGQPDQEEVNQLEMTTEDNRYETERQAAAAPTKQQQAQSQTLDRLKQMARRQQDLNDRLRDLQTALQEARTDGQREEIQRQLKRLRDEEHQMLADVDELRQQLEQSPGGSKQSNARQQLEQTHTDVQRAAQELEHQAVSEALAAGSRAEQKLQDLRENMRQQASSQFAQQMREMRNQARDLANQEKQIAHDLDKLNNSGQKVLDNSAPRQSLVEQLGRQQSALTNLLGQMRAVTEQAESTEPLLSKQLYDILRHTDQTHTDSQLEMSGRLVDRGFLPQASQVEHTARQSIDELRQGVDHAAESVLGSEADALRYAKKQLDDLTGQMSKELKGGTNSAATSGEQGHANSEGNPSKKSQNAERKPGNSKQSQSPATSGEQAEANSEGNGSESSPHAGNKPGDSKQAQSSGTSPGGRQAASAQTQGGGKRGGNSDREKLRQFAQQLGGGAGGLGENGPITGNNYANWADNLRDVEQAVDSPDVRNQLATVRERVGVYRRAYRENGRTPSNAELQTKVLEPLALARDWVGQELSRAQNDGSLVPLDRDPVQDKYSDLVRKYYEKLGSSQ